MYKDNHTKEDAICVVHMEKLHGNEYFINLRRTFMVTRRDMMNVEMLVHDILRLCTVMWDVCCRVWKMFSNVPEECTASIFRTEYLAEHAAPI
jgi:hypothetical protein